MGTIYKKTCETGKIYYGSFSGTCEKAKENYYKYRDKRIENYIKNRETILEKQKEKISCEHCGSIISNSSYTRHRRTKKCLEAQ